MIKHGNIEPLTVEKLSPNTLSKEEIETFNHYLLNDINLKIALGNSDFRKIYRKIAGSYTDESIRTIMNDNE